MARVVISVDFGGVQGRFAGGQLRFCLRDVGGSHLAGLESIFRIRECALENANVVLLHFQVRVSRDTSMYTLAADSSTDSSIIRSVSRAAKTWLSAERTLLAVCWPLKSVCVPVSPTECGRRSGL